MLAGWVPGDHTDPSRSPNRFPMKSDLADQWREKKQGVFEEHTLLFLNY